MFVRNIRKKDLQLCLPHIWISSMDDIKHNAKTILPKTPKQLNSIINNYFTRNKSEIKAKMLESLQKVLLSRMPMM